MTAYHLIGGAVILFALFILALDYAARTDGHRDVWDGLWTKWEQRR